MESARTPAAARTRKGLGGLFALALALASLGASPAAAAPELASVTLPQDAVWEGRVEVDGQVTVPGGVTLLLRPGTEVRFAARPGAEPADKARLVIRGALVAEGTPEHPIRFLSADPEPQPGDWGGLVIEDTRGRTSRLRHCRIEHADEGLRVKAASAVVENSVLTRNRTGFVGLRHGDGGLFATEVSDNATGLFFRQSTGLRVEQCRILGNREGGIVCSYGSAPALAGNEIGENAVGGIACVQGSSPSIEANEIRGHEYGVHVDLKSNPLLLGNRIHGNGTGLWAVKLSNPTVAQNAVTGNGVGIFCDHSAYPRVHDNDLSGNTRFAMVLGDHQSIHVEQRIPYRDLGQFHPEAPARPQTLPPRTRKFTAFSGSSLGLLDARGNWWGHEPTAEMAALGAEGNVGAI
ncbi:MAG: right-handed parallel beta-helix repeat-containing protein, partial [Thermodesulfobacteriota bacterium]